MILAGRLSGTLDGRPVVIEADESGITLSVAKFRTAWNLRSYGNAFSPVFEILKGHGLSVRLKIADIVALEVLPRPSAVVQMFVPALSL